MVKITHLHINGLFGYAKRDIEFFEQEPTILTGANGCGKTQTLRTIQALLRVDVSSLLSLPFREAAIRLDDKTSFGINKDSETPEEGSLELWVETKSRVAKHNIPYIDVFRWEKRKLRSLRDPNSLDGDFYAPVARSMNPSALRAKYGESIHIELLNEKFNKGYNQGLELDADLVSFLEHWPRIPSITLDTKRLDSANALIDRTRGASSRAYGQKLATSRIEEYMGRIRNQVDRAKFRAIQANQSADSSFAARALDKAHATVNEHELRSQYKTIVERSEALANNGLHSGEVPPPLREERMNPTEKRILSVFLDDWDKRMSPLEPINEKIVLFRKLLDGKLAASYKGTAERDSGIGIVDSYNDPVEVSQLSSGEQHLVALFTRLLFDTRPGSVVLIDEPEISLHPAWQKEFVEDLSRIREKVDAQWIIATHSPSLVNGRWELEQALKIDRPPRGPAFDERNLDMEDDIESVDDEIIGDSDDD